jgi:hypothetical protein
MIDVVRLQKLQKTLYSVSLLRIFYYQLCGAGSSLVFSSVSNRKGRRQQSKHEEGLCARLKAVEKRFRLCHFFQFAS